MHVKTPVILDYGSTSGAPSSGVGAGLALLYLLGDEGTDVLGVTTAFGHAKVDAVHRQTKWLLRMLGREEIPAFAGAPEPGWGSTEAAHFLAKTVRTHPGELMVVTLGPWSNLAAAAGIYEGFFPHLRKLVCLGGWAAEPTNHRGSEPDGAALDPAAALAVLSSGHVPVVVTEELYAAAAFPRSRFSRGFWPTWLEDPVGRALRRPRLRRRLGRLNVPEVLPAVYVIRPELFEDRTRTFSPRTEDFERGVVEPVDPGKGVRINTPL